MNVYLVRLIEEQEIVGVFAAKNINNLYDLVDECVSPYECEYAKLPEGGLCWLAPRSPKVSSKKQFNEDADETNWFGKPYNVTLNETWTYEFECGDKMIWSPLTSDELV